jgi:hypothetical protein
LASDSFTTVASLFCRLVTVFAGMLQVPSCALAREGAKNNKPTVDAIKYSFIIFSPVLCFDSATVPALQSQTVEPSGSMLVSCTHRGLCL